MYLILIVRMVVVSALALISCLDSGYVLNCPGFSGAGNLLLKGYASWLLIFPECFLFSCIVKMIGEVGIDFVFVSA